MPHKVLGRLLEIVAAARPGHAPRVVLDVGARDCRESLDFAAAYPAATVYAFEKTRKRQEHDSGNTGKINQKSR